MTEPYLGEIRMFAGNFSPKNNAFCAGQLLSISQNSALFSLLGTQFGGDGVNTFGLPDMRGRLPVCYGQGPGLSNYVMGEQTGTESVTLILSQLPVHNHMIIASSTTGNQPTPSGNMPAGASAPFTGLWIADSAKTGNPIVMDANSLAMTGGHLPHENRMPALAINFIIALVGIFPSRN
jgi:microcystin-dependent protein